MEKVYIVEGLRTVIGKPHKSLKKYKAVDLASVIMTTLVKKVALSGKSIDQVIVGNTLSAGLGQNVARQAVALSGFPLTIPAYVIDNVCGSGLEGVLVACDSIRIKRNQAVMCIGAESVTHAPLLVPFEKEESFTAEDCQESLREDGLYCHITQKLMGELAEDLAQRQGISRAEQDEFTFKSHQKAKEASEQGCFLEEIVAMEDHPENKPVQDDCIRKRISLERLTELPSAFRENGTLTAGNSSRICDGAAGVMVAGQTFLEKNNLIPQAEILEIVSIANDPQFTYENGSEAIDLCLRKAGISLKDVDCFEICEAFAAQIIYTYKKAGIPESQMNLAGGDIALGHPMGASGLRAVVTLMHVLKRKKKNIGLACVSFGGGGSIAVLIKRAE